MAGRQGQWLRVTGCQCGGARGAVVESDRVLVWRGAVVEGDRVPVWRGAGGGG